MQRFEEDEDDDEDWDDDSDDESLIECPHCGEEIYEDAQRCPECGQYLSEEDAPPARKPWWIVITAIVCLYLVWRWIAG